MIKVLWTLFTGMVFVLVSHSALAQSREQISLRVYAGSGYSEGQFTHFIVRDADAVTRAELLRIVEYLESNNLRPNWEGFWSVPSTNTFMACPHWDLGWVPCATYDRREYVSCVAEMQSNSATNSASLEQKEACYYDAITN